MSLTKSDHIRKLLERSLDTPAAEIVDKLSQRGIEVTSGLVHVVKSQIRKKLQEEEAARQQEARRQQQERERLQAEQERQRAAVAAEAERQRVAEQERLAEEKRQMEATRQAAAAKSEATKKANTKPLNQFVREIKPVRQGNPERTPEWPEQQGTD